METVHVRPSDCIDSRLQTIIGIGIGSKFILTESGADLRASGTY